MRPNETPAQRAKREALDPEGLLPEPRELVLLCGHLWPNKMPAAVITFSEPATFRGGTVRVSRAYGCAACIAEVRIHAAATPGKPMDVTVWRGWQLGEASVEVLFDGGLS